MPRAIAEVTSVAHPAAGVGRVVQAFDTPQWWDLDLPEAIRHKIDTPPMRSLAKVSPTRTFTGGWRPGLSISFAVRHWSRSTVRAAPIWRNRENHVLPLLSPDELPLSRRSSPNVTWDKMLVDAMTMRMVMKPQTLDTTSPPTCIRTSCPTWPPHWLARPSRAYSARYYGPA
jgi:hypothetical protein